MKQPSALLTTLRLPRRQVWPARPSVASATSALTCVVDDEARVAHRGIAAEGEEEAVAAALDAAWQLGAIEASYQRAERVPSVVDMKEVVAGLQIKAGEQKKNPAPTPLRLKKSSYCPQLKDRASQTASPPTHGHSNPGIPGGEGQDEAPGPPCCTKRQIRQARGQRRQIPEPASRKLQLRT